MMPVRWKLFAALLLLMMVMGGTSYAYLRRTLEQDLLADLRQKLLGEAALAAQLVQRDSRTLRSAGSDLAAVIGSRLSVRATLIDSDGNVVGDSEVAATDLHTLDNHGSRPEVQAALSHGNGMALRYSETLQRDMLYVATRVMAERPEQGVVRLAVPLAAIEQAKRGLVASLTLALLLVVGLSLLLTQLAGRKMQALREGAERFGAGDFRRRLPLGSHDELDTLAQAMNSMAERLQTQMEHLDIKRLERVRRDFVANVSHELRTPVCVIRGYAETLAGGLAQDDPTTATRFAGIIQSHADRLTSLIADLLTLSSLEATDNALELQALALAPVTTHCCQLLTKKAEERGVVLDCGGVDEHSVFAHRGRLEQVLLNLLDNAIKHAPGGSTVKLAARADGEMVEISVMDHGPGIPAEALPRLFERFYRVDAGRSRDQGGTGLGLAIVKHLVQLHGGRVWIESTPGQGTSAYFTLRRHAGSI